VSCVYYQVSLETEDPGDDVTDPLGLDSPYLIVQRRCYVETHDHRYVGHYRLKLIDFGPTQLVVAIERNSNTHVEVTYVLDAVEFNEVQRIVNIIFDRHGRKQRSFRLGHGLGSHTVVVSPHSATYAPIAA
jgi:hypothetical protein